MMRYGWNKSPGLNVYRLGVLHVGSFRFCQDSLVIAVMSVARRGLFGNAIYAVLPDGLVDASELRQIPDNQEVFVHRLSDISLIFEVLESVEATESEEIARLHFSSLAHDNSATLSECKEVLVIHNDRGDKTPSAIVVSGIQHVEKFNKNVPDEVKILMAIFRVQKKKADLVVTFNIPISSNGITVGQDLLEAQTQFDTLVRSLEIRDFDLFADPDVDVDISGV